MRRNLLRVFACLALVVTLTACGKADNGVLKVGMECNYAPFNWEQSEEGERSVAISGGGYCAGYDVQIAQKVADELGMELQVVKTAWEGLEPALSAGAIDVIIAGMSPMADRKERLDFSENYYTSDLVLVVKKGSAYENATQLSDFSGARVVAQQGTFHDTVIDQIEGVKHATPMETFPSMIVALNSGVVDAIVFERPGAVGAMKTNSNLVMIDFGDNGFEASEEDVSVAVGMKKGSELREKINNALAKISQEDRDEMMEWAIENQ